MWRDLATVSISCMADVSIMSAIQDYSYIFWSRTWGGVHSPQSWPSGACWRGPPSGPNRSVMRWVRPTDSPLVFMCYFRSAS